MNFNIQRHIRIAGTVIVFIGFALSNWSVVLFGWVTVAVGYMHSIAKIERHLESLNSKEEEEK